MFSFIVGSVAEINIESSDSSYNEIYTLFSNDSLEYIDSQNELARLKEVINLSREREVEVFQLLLTKNHFINNKVISEMRANLTLDAYRKEFEGLLNSDELENLHDLGLIEDLFKKKDQD